LHDIDIEYFSFPFLGGHVTYILVIISLSILYSQAGFLYNVRPTFGLISHAEGNFPTLRSILWVGPLSGRVSVEVNLSTSQGKPTSNSTVGIQLVGLCLT